MAALAAEESVFWSSIPFSPSFTFSLVLIVCGGWAAIKQSSHVNVQILRGRKISSIKNGSRQWNLFQQIISYNYPNLKYVYF